MLAEAAKADLGWVLRDYHSPNLIWLPEREGVKKVGILDFQDALLGPLAYDVVSLLQDARLDVPEALERELLGRYCSARGAQNKDFSGDRFVSLYATLGAQRNSKILGIFARLAKRDGKRGYLAHIRGSRATSSATSLIPLWPRFATSMRANFLPRKASRRSWCRRTRQ